MGHRVDQARLAASIDMGYAFGDACVAIDGYPLRVLPPSGVMQIAAYEAINVEVLAHTALAVLLCWSDLAVPRTKCR